MKTKLRPRIGLLPTGLNMVYLYDAKTSALKCVMEGGHIRNLRTAAAAACPTALPGRPEPKPSDSLNQTGSSA